MGFRPEGHSPAAQNGILKNLITWIDFTDTTDKSEIIKKYVDVDIMRAVKLNRDDQATQER